MNRNSMEVIEQSVVPWLQSPGYRLRTVWASPSIKLFKNDTFVITSRSCYFSNKNQNELNRIADDALNEVSITVIGEKTKWVFRK